MPHSAYSAGDPRREHRIGGRVPIAPRREVPKEWQIDGGVSQLLLYGISEVYPLAFEVNFIPLTYNYPAEGFNLGDILGNNGGLLSLVITIEFGNIVNLHVILDSISKTSGLSVYLNIEASLGGSLTCGDQLVDTRYILP